MRMIVTIDMDIDYDGCVDYTVNIETDGVFGSKEHLLSLVSYFVKEDLLMRENPSFLDEHVTVNGHDIDTVAFVDGVDEESELIEVGDGMIDYKPMPIATESKP